MDEFAKKLAGMSPKRLAILAMELQAKLDAIEASPSQPIAIIGMSCRFPGGAGTPRAYWQLLREGRDGIGLIPPDRWDVEAYYDPDPDAPGKMYSRHGGFIEDVDRFDPQFFGISPREAVSMDPQQRLLLEVCWEALEDAARPPDTERGSRTGVFVGITANDYSELLARGGLASLDAYSMTGNALNFAAGRLSYVLGLQGPSLAVDTACSSSLVAVHLACQSLRSGDSRMALAAGVNLMLSPVAHVVLSRARMLAADGRCKTFDAAADGYVRGEGCGVVVLKRLSDAMADGDRVLAVIRGSAVNQDGPSGGLTVPNGPAQQAVIRDALARAGVRPHQVDYVEAHGTGTSLGDPIEIEALGAVLGEGRSKDHPVLVGAAKTNIGHLESAAGIAGLIKVVLALQHQEVPPHLHLTQLNPHIRLDEIPAAIPMTLTPWRQRGDGRIAGVSAFGASGTNAHVILAEAPAPAPRGAAIERPRHLFTLSAKSADALAALANRYAEHLGGDPSVSLADLCFTANAGRVHFACRAALTATSVSGLRDALLTFAEGREESGAVRRGRATGELQPKIAFAFTGQGAQRTGMGRELYETQPTFRAALDRCAEILRGELDRPLLEVLYPPAGAPSPIDETAYTQPALFAVEYALSELWRSWGIRPALVVGHSIGEYVAACVAGVFSLEDGLKLVAARGRLMQELPAGGGMVAVTADEARVRAAMAPAAGSVAIAAVNAPGQVVLAGETEVLRRMVAALQADGAPATWLPVSHAFHSPLIEPMLDAFERVAERVTYRRPALGLVSNVTGELVDEAEVATAGYWRRHARETVQYARGVETLHRLGCRVFVEVGPRPTLIGLGQQTVADPDVAWAASLRPGRRDWEQMLETLAMLYVRGLPMDWAGFDRDYGRSKVALPTYPFQRQRYWVDPPQMDPSTVPGSTSARPDPLYEITWLERTLPLQSVHGPATVVVFADRTGLTDPLVSALRSRGHRAVVVQAAGQYALVANDQFEIDPTQPEDFARLWDELLASCGGSPLILAYLWSLDLDGGSAASSGEGMLKAVADNCGMLSDLVRAATAAGRTTRTRLNVVTRGAHAVMRQSRISVEQSPVVGLVRTIRNEYPELGSSSVDLDPDGELAAEAVAAELLADGASEDVSFRNGRRLVARLMLRAAERVPAVRLRGDATYLITGGLGALGLVLARWMVQQGARHLVLIGRRVPPSTAAVLEELEAEGATVRAMSADVVSAQDVARVLDAIDRELPPLRGVIHAAGVLDDGVLAQQTRERFDRVLAPKVAGAWNLHAGTRDRPLDFFVLFSSIAGVLGSAGQGNYAAANVFLDALAGERRRLGLPALSIAWGPWAEAGMAAAVSDANRQRWAASGLRPIASREALRLFGCLLSIDTAHTIVLPLDRSVAETTPLFADLEPGGRSLQPRAAGKDEMLRRVREAPPAERRELVSAFCVRQVAEVTGLADVAGDQPLARLGLDSLMALELRNRIQRAFGATVPVVSFLDGTDANALAASILQQLETREGSTGQGTDGGPQTFTAPLSSAQSRIWFFEQLRPGTGTFNDQLVIRFTGALDVAALVRVFRRIVRRHGVLRTTIVSADDGPMQAVAASLERIPFEIIDVRSSDTARADAQRLVNAALREPFDLERGPLFRARITSLSSTEHVLAYAIHHIINDGSSLRVLVGEVAALYAAEVTGRPNPLPPLPVQYAALVRRQQRALATDLYGDDVAYWRDRLANAPAITELPTDFPRVDGVSPAGASESRLLDGALGDALKDLARTRGATPFMVLLAAFKCLLSRLTGQYDLVVGSPVSGRSAEAEPLIGCFINQIALRTDLSGDPSFLEVLDRVRETALGAYAHQELPFEKLVEALHPVRDANHPPFFQILFNMLVAPPSRIELPGVVGEVESTGDGWAKFDLTMYVLDRDDGLGLHLVYNANLYTPATARMVIGRFEQLLAQVTADPTQPVSAYSLLTSSEQDSLVGAFSSQLE